VRGQPVTDEYLVLRDIKEQIKRVADALEELVVLAKEDV